MRNAARSLPLKTRSFRLLFPLWRLKTIARFIFRFRMILTILIAFFFLSGCVQYDVGVHFVSPNRGEVVQHIRLDDKLTTFSGSVTQDGLKRIEQRTRQQGGKVRRLSAQELVVTIPFNNSADLQTKLNAFFQHNEPQNDPSIPVSDLPQVDTHLDIHESNFLVVVRDRFQLDVDLRSLAVLSSNGNLLVNPGSLFELEFRLETPWGAQSIARSNPPIRQGNQLVWQLQPGEMNHLEAVFWMPSSIGIGALIILLVVIAGSSFKAQLSPAEAIASEPHS